MVINIYQNTNASSYVLIHSQNNIDSLEINKSTGIIPFSLPIVDNTTETSGRMITENIEFIHIGGVEATINMDFIIDMNKINTMLGLVSNKVSKKHKIDISEWSGQTSGYSFIGIIDKIRLRQEGGDPTLTCSLSFLEGANPLGDFTGF